jgi:formate hydrogenlyase transcriptional activator
LEYTILTGMVAPRRAFNYIVGEVAKGALGELLNRNWGQINCSTGLLLIPRIKKVAQANFPISVSGVNMDSLQPYGTKGNILLIANQVEMLRTLSGIMIEQGHMVRVAKDSSTAILAIESQPPELILLSSNSDAVENQICQKLKSNERYTDIQILFVLPSDNSMDKIKGFEVGRADYITNPIQAEEVMARVNTHITIGRLRSNFADITDRGVAELNESEERYRSIVDASLNSIMIIRGGCFLLTNPACARMFGFSDPEKTPGMDVLEVVAPNSRQFVIDRMKRLEKGKNNPTAEIELVKRDGTRIIAESTSVSILLQGKPSGVIIARDITKMKQAEQINEEHLRFQALIAGISSKFTGLTGSEFDDAIQSTLGELGRHFDVDTVRLYRLSPKGDVVKFRFAWRSDDLAPPKEMTEIHKTTYPNLAAHYMTGKSMLFNNIDECPQIPELMKILNFFGTRAGLGVPLEIDDTGVDVFAMDKILSKQVWSREILKHSLAIGKVILSALRRREAEIRLENSYNKIKQLKDRLEQENIYLQHEIDTKFRHGEIVGESRAIKHVLTLAEKVANEDTSVLILGETGTGKELLARAIHKLSLRKDQTMIKINCAALPATLIESELFGREKGAYTGALTKQIGRFEASNDSTIFLDEIGDLPLELQSKLLRVLQEGQFERIGSLDTISVDVRVIAATNRDLDKRVLDGRFRNDLFYRLNVFPITMPPLRDRRDDIPLLTWAFIKEFNNSMGKKVSDIKKRTMDLLNQYSWPGNVRELKNIIERAMILTDGSELKISRLEPSTTDNHKKGTLDEIQIAHIKQTLETTGWRISGKNGAARILGVKPTTLRSKMDKLGIERNK